MPDPILRRLARNTGWLLGGKAANAVIGLAVLAVAARALGPEGLGRLVMLQSLVQFTAEVAKFQSWQGVVRYGAQALNGRGDLGRLVAFSLALDAGSAVAGLAFMVLAGPVVAAGLGWPADVVALVPLYGTAVVFLVAGTATGLLRLFDRFDLLAAQSATGNLIRLGGALVAWAAGAGIEAFALAWWLAAVGAGVMPFPAALRRLAANGGRLRSPRGIRADHPGILGFFLLTSANSIIALAPGHLATLILGSLLGPAAAGLFRVCRQIADAAAKPADFLAQALYPEAARLAVGDDRKRLRAMLRRVGLVVAPVAGLAVALLGGWGGALLGVVAGPGFTLAAPLLALLAVAASLAMAAVPLEPALIALGRTGAVVAAKAAAAAVHVGLLVALAPAVGLRGAGWAAIIAAAVALGPLAVIAVKALADRAPPPRPPPTPPPNARPPCASAPPDREGAEGPPPTPPP